MMKSLRGFWKLFSKNKRTKDSPKVDDLVGSREQNQKAPVQRPQKTLSTPQRILIKKQSKINIQVGLDFGTSSTKVVFSQLGKKSFRVVNFGHIMPGYPPYCIPSVGCIGDNGKLLLGVSAAKYLINKAWDSGLQRLKVLVAGKYDENFKDKVTENRYYEHFSFHKVKPIDPEILSAVFISYVMYNTRKMIRRYPEYQGANLDFAFNVCMPIDHVQNNLLNDVFKRIFYWAELIENEWHKNEDGFNPLTAARTLENSSPKEETKVFAVPEAVASFASYLVSLRKREGLHAIIDLGSGTTDVSICNLYLKTENPKTFWYAARNIPTGTAKVERALADAISTSLAKSSCSLNDMCTCLESIAKNENEENCNNELETIIYNKLRELRDSKAYKKTWGSAYAHMKKDFLWKDVEVFTCGGGSFFPHVDKTFSEPWWKNLNTKYRVTRLPVPDNFIPGSSGAVFERMSVAYGLAIPLPQLEEYILPDDCPDHTPPSPPIYNPDRDDLYPK